MLEFTGAGLGDFHVGNEGENDICWVSLLEMGFNSEGISRVNEDAGVLRSDDGFDDGGEVVDIGQCFYTENNIVVCVFAR